jgi:hydroxymethylpyrimidine/phosphomethylpyrimidine kinase
MQGRVLIIAGSDPSGGAGIQADIKTVTALGGYAATAITALTAQNTTGVFGVLDVPPGFIAQQIRLVLEDIGADSIKIGMLHKTEVIEAVAGALEGFPGIPHIVDPVMVAKSGDPLLDPAAVAALKEQIVARALVVTPNLREAEALLGLSPGSIDGVDAMRRAAENILALGPTAVLVKGGHAEGGTVFDVLETAKSPETFEHPRLETTSTHGTGCTLSSAIATGIAQDLSLREAVARALDYVHAAIRSAPQIGHGRGPLNHAHTFHL